MKLTLILIAALSCITGNVFAQGLLLVKPYTFDQESAANPLEYKTATKFGTVYNLVTASGQAQSIVTGLIVRDIVYSDLKCPETIISRPDADRIAANLATIKDTITKWPGSRKYLERHLIANQFAFDQLKQGNLLTAGKWVSGQAYRASLAAAQKAAEAAHQKEMLAAQERQRNAEAARQKEQEAMRAAREKKLEVERTAALARATQLEETLNALKSEAIELAGTVRDPVRIQKRAFSLKRKLPKSDFEELYEVGPYVFQGITRGGELCPR